MLSHNARLENPEANSLVCGGLWCESVVVSGDGRRREQYS